MILLLRASSAPVSLSDIAHSMYMPAETIEPVLNTLVKQGIIQTVTGQTKCYICLPATVELREAIEEVVRAYSQKRPAVISLIFSSPLEDFSGAFKLRGQED